jgi:hypothetical protein
MLAFALLTLSMCCVQIADSIPSKILPSKAKRTKTSKKNKGKRSSGPSTTSTKRPLDNEGSTSVAIDLTVDDGPEPKRHKKVCIHLLLKLVCLLPALQGGSKEKSAIYYFFEQVDQDEHGNKEDGTKYFKCWLGNRKTVKMTKKMKYSTNSEFHLPSNQSCFHTSLAMKSHLEKNFPAHWSLYKALDKRDGPATKAEVEYAQGKRALDATAAKKYMDELDKIQGNIREMLLRQAAAAEVRAFES